MIQVGWGRDEPAYRQLFASLFVPGADMALARHFSELQKLSASTTGAARIVSVMDRLDVTESARRLRVPTLVLHNEADQRIPFDQGRRLAAEIPGAHFVPLPGANHIMQAGEPGWTRFLHEIEVFTGVGDGARDAASHAIVETLTARERTVLAELATGVGNARIASRLHLSPKTVRNHVSRILDKLGVHSRGEAIVAARQAGLGNPSDDC